MFIFPSFLRCSFIGFILVFSCFFVIRFFHLVPAAKNNCYSFQAQHSYSCFLSQRRLYSSQRFDAWFGTLSTCKQNSCSKKFDFMYFANGRIYATRSYLLSFATSIQTIKKKQVFLPKSKQFNGQLENRITFRVSNAQKQNQSSHS